MHVSGETQAGLIYDSSFMSHIAPTVVVKFRVRDLKIVLYRFRGGRNRLKTAAWGVTSVDTEA